MNTPTVSWSAWNSSVASLMSPRRLLIPLESTVQSQGWSFSDASISLLSIKYWEFHRVIFLAGIRKFTELTNVLMSMTL
ncbi:hypothetical protein OUZ56_012352 [Daphnia magna]|uniref:Uncharacterized protein n=1 Tax=Daphnia magna TaxID=35525 RepID=A0ABQ9Z2R6_9CRUS|nr:hypothetical protein OUZ56_012352 [Daphnia magna]